MKEQTALSHDGCTLQCGNCDQAPGKPWIALIIPFGLKVRLARAVSQPTLLLAGRCDQQTNISSSLRIKQAIGDAQMLVEPEGNHYELLRPGSPTLGSVRSFLMTQGDRHA